MKIYNIIGIIMLFGALAIAISGLIFHWSVTYPITVITLIVGITGYVLAHLKNPYNQ